jgi:hypothetical protein
LCLLISVHLPAKRIEDAWSISLIHSPSWALTRLAPSTLQTEKVPSPTKESGRRGQDDRKRHDLAPTAQLIGLTGNWDWHWRYQDHSVSPGPQRLGTCPPCRFLRGTCPLGDEAASSPPSRGDGLEKSLCRRLLTRGDPVAEQTRGDGRERCPRPHSRLRFKESSLAQAGQAFQISKRSLRSSFSYPL